MARRPQSPRPARKAPTRPPVRRRVGCAGWLARLLGLGLLLVLAGLGALWFMWGRDLPNVSDLDVLEYSGQTRVYDRTGALIGTLTPSLSSGQSVNRDLKKLNEVSGWLQKAVVSSEDRRFYEHHGVDYIGIARGLLKGLLRNDLEGGSSITQQVVKNTLLADLQSARTPERKFKEAILAYQLDRDFNKDKILNAYLNIIYWGDAGRSDIVGAGMAARAYFKKDARELNLAESVYLATIIPAPNRRYKDFGAYRNVMKSLLTRMVEDGRATRAEADAAWKTKIYPAGYRISWNEDGTFRYANLENLERRQLNLDQTESRGQGKYQYQAYMQAVEKELLPRVGRKELYAGGKIFTGMDIAAQVAAEKASLDASLPPGATLGLALVNPANGEALALVGQKLTGDRPRDWNNALQARRQVGSSIKPLLYTLALSKGWKQSDTVLDSPIEGDYQPMNYDRRWTGRYVTMRYSLDHSLNLPTVRMGQELGMPTFEAKLRELGLTPPPNAGLSLSIGTLEASPLQMAAAYAPFVNGGIYFEPHTVRKFEDRHGQSVYTHQPVSRRVWDEQTAWLGLDMLRGVVNDLTPSQGGLATRAMIDGWEVGGKTGTTNDIKDLWFAGVTSLISGAVWVGQEDGTPLPSWAYSGDVPTPVWQQAVAGALAGRSKTNFKEPANIAYRVVRRVNMAFRAKEADTDPVARDGSRQAEQTGQATGQDAPDTLEVAPVEPPPPVLPDSPSTSESNPAPDTQTPATEVPAQDGAATDIPATPPTPEEPAALPDTLPSPTDPAQNPSAPSSAPDAAPPEILPVPFDQTEAPSVPADPNALPELPPTTP
ncbi:peptidoglycan glycosyltransferase [Deinococcus cavernae]|uniref:peptidoglycan glycosyltransferase n=1 Tax=Deinococcus cavernae TaxID=2320857 RepID=A0A418VBB9_9DEIO|nr:peptidoglycan glycosyltransferase [Deinococcus cavernae]